VTHVIIVVIDADVVAFPVGGVRPATDPSGGGGRNAFAGGPEGFNGSTARANSSRGASSTGSFGGGGFRGDGFRGGGRRR